MDLAAAPAYAEMGDFEFQSNPWNKEELVEGQDFTQSLGFTRNGSVRLQWYWPKLNDQVRSYPGFIWGQKPWSTVSTTSSMPQRLNEGAQISVDFDLEWAPPPRGNFNVSFDLWIASSAVDAPGTSLSEVMIWVKNWDWGPSEAPVGHFADANGRAAIFHRPDHVVFDDSWAYTAVIYETDVERGTIDVDALLGQLAQLGILDANHLLMDIELGVEIVNGSGWLEVKQLDIDKDGRRVGLLEAAAEYLGASRE